MAFILKGVPSELMSMLAVKSTAEAAWETLKMMRMGIKRVHEVKAKTL